MRTMILTCVCLLCSLFVQAQDAAILQSIEQANAKIKSLESPFVQVQTSLAKEESVESKGILYLNGTDQMAMHYEAPSTDLLIINGADFYLCRGNRKKLYNTEKNATMRRLSNILLLCLHGKPQQLAAETESLKLTVEKTAKAYVVTLTTEKKQTRGYAKIILTYDLVTKLLTNMQMDEFNGNSTTYTLNRIKTDVSVSTSVFELPKK